MTKQKQLMKDSICASLLYLHEKGVISFMENGCIIEKNINDYVDMLIANTNKEEASKLFLQASLDFKPKN